MSTVRVPRRQRLILEGVDWQTYSRLLRTFAERPGIRLTYDRGTLEIMSPSHAHDIDSRFLGRLVVTLTEELGLPVKSGGSTTLRRRKKRRGLEPDECFWIKNEALVRSLRVLRLHKDPPPDLAIEVDVTSSSLDRMSIYAALAIPEVWRLDAEGLSFHHLQPDSTYAKATHSQTFPFVTPADLTGFANRRIQDGDNAVVQDFRRWIRARPQ